MRKKRKGKHFKSHKKINSDIRVREGAALRFLSKENKDNSQFQGRSENQTTCLGPGVRDEIGTVVT